MGTPTQLLVAGIEDDAHLRKRFIDTLFREYGYSPDDTITLRNGALQVHIVDRRNHTDYAAHTGVLTVAVFNGDKPVQQEHIRLAAHADWTIEVLGIIPEDRYPAYNGYGDIGYIHESDRYLIVEYNQFERVWTTILKAIDTINTTTGKIKFEFGQHQL
jgi:hypothetical protein